MSGKSLKRGPPAPSGNVVFGEVLPRDVVEFTVLGSELLTLDGPLTGLPCEPEPNDLLLALSWLRSCRMNDPAATSVCALATSNASAVPRTVLAVALSCKMKGKPHE